MANMRMMGSMLAAALALFSATMNPALAQPAARAAAAPPPAGAQGAGGRGIVPTTAEQDQAMLTRDCGAAAIPLEEKGKAYAIKKAWFIPGVDANGIRKPSTMYACIETDQKPPARFAVFHSTWSPLAPNFYGEKVITCPDTGTVLCTGTTRRSFVVPMTFGGSCLRSVTNGGAVTSYICPIRFADTGQMFIGLTAAGQPTEFARFLRLSAPPIQ